MVFDNDLLDISNSNLGVLKRMGVKKNKVAIRDVSVGDINSKNANNDLNHLGTLIAGFSSFLLFIID